MYREHPPPLALRPYVACLWTVRREAGAPQRVLPDGCMDLLIDATTGTARVIGAMTAAVVAAGGTDLVGVRFRPGEAPSLLGLSASDATDRALPLDALWGSAGRELGERLASVPGTRDRLALLAQSLTPRIGTRWTDRRVRRAVAAIAAETVPIPAIAAEVGLGERQLERLFADRVGIGPKRLARVLRLQRAVARPADLATIAVRHGFSDPSHVVREFRALCGATPARLFHEMSEMSETSNGDPVGPDTPGPR